MTVPALGRASLLPGPSSRVHHFTVITVILVATVIASSQPKDLCRQDRANFVDQIHTIGSIDDALWAITKNDWQVYKLTPCDPANDSLVHCMKVDSPVEVNTKWPKLAEVAKSEAQTSDLSFPVDNSVVMDTEHTVLVMHGASFKTNQYFGFDFGKDNQATAQGGGEIFQTPGLWISSDVKDKAYRLLDANKQVDLVEIVKGGETFFIQIKLISKAKYICIDANEGLKVQFKNQSNCDPKMDGSVKKAVLYRKQFYFFTSDKVYIFSDQAETGLTKMLSVSLKDFFHCFEPTTMAPPSSASNATNPRANSTNSTHISTTAKSSSTTIIIIVVVVIGLVVILALITAYFCWCRTKASKDGKSDGNAILGSSSPNDSKVSVKVQAVSKGAPKQSQTKAKAVVPNTSLGKQSPKPKASSSARILIKVDTDAIERKLAERRELSRELAQIGKRMAKAKESTVPNLPHF